MIARENIGVASTATRPSGKIVVALVALGWLLLASPFPKSLSGFGIAVVLALAALDLLLAITTEWLAFKATHRLDEREIELRNQAYRIGFRLIAVGILVMFALVIVGSIVGGSDAGFAQLAAQLPDGFSGRTIAALLELLVILPTAAIAWLQPADAGSGTTGANRWLPFAAIPVVVVAWLLIMSWGPAQLLPRVGPNGGFSMANASCQHYAAQRRVGLGFGAAIRVGAEVCWNGQQAFVVGNPSLTPAGATLPQESPPYLADLFSCAPYPTDVDFASASQQCIEQIDSSGTMTLTAKGSVSPVPGGIARRQLEIQLIIDRNGKVLRFE